MPAFAYVRHTAPNLLDAQAQRETIEARGAELDVPIVAWLEDGREARKTPLRERPAGGMLCRQLQPGDHVLVACGSLLTASSRDLRETVADWNRRGIALHLHGSAYGWIDTSQNVDGANVGELVLQVIDSAGEQRREAIREGILVRRLQRKPHGRYPPLGMMVQHGADGPRLVPDPEEIDVMRQIAVWRNEGRPWERIYFELLKRRVRTRDGREWSVMRIRRAYDRVCQLCEAIEEEAASDGQ